MSAVRALREGVALARPKRTVMMRFAGGDGAWETLNHLSSSDLFLRDTQMIHTLWLHEDATPLADVYVCRDDADFVVLAEGRGDELLAHANAHLRAGATMEDLSKRYTMLALHGPFAWELMGALVGGEVIGVPYLSMFKMDDGLGFRAGKTGEYGYELMVDVDRAEAFERRVRDAGVGFDLRDVDATVLDQCQLENWFFNVRREGARGLSPLELQLQWRTSLAKEYVGSVALAEMRRAGIKRRVTTLATQSPVREGEHVHAFGEEVGEVLVSGHSEIRGDHVVLALIDLRLAHSGIDAFEIAGKPARSTTPPVLDNRSLYINPQMHSYQTRASVEFPPLVTP